MTPQVKPEVRVESPFPLPYYFDLYTWAEPVWNQIADDFTPTDREGFIEQQMAIGANAQTWGVWIGDEIGGYVSAVIDPRRDWIANCHCLFKKSFWGKDITEVALNQIARGLFSTGILKIEMWVFKRNSAVRGLIHRLGGREEGELTAQTMKDNTPASLVVYGLFEEDLKEGI